MSRVGKQPVVVPSGVKASVQAGVVMVEGPKGKLSYKPTSDVVVDIKEGKVIVSPTGVVKSKSGKDEIPKQIKANYGTARATINNMVLGVTKGFKRSLELNGVGFTAKLAGQVLTLTVGFSHDVLVDIPKEVKCVVVKNVIELESADKQLLGTLASGIRKIQPPEPYLGKGIKYSDEKVRRKAGKTGKK